jgi:hypothetical protein
MESTIEQLHSALATRDFSLLEPMLANDVRFGSCVGRPQVVEYLSRKFSGGIAVEFAEIEAHPDRLIARLELTSPEPGQFPFGQQTHFAVLFMHDGQIIELQVAEDHDHALAAVPSPLPPPRPNERTTLNAMATVLPVRDLALALEHYRRLGFSVRAYQGGGYGYAERDGLNLHLNVVPSLNSATTTSAVYLYVDDADLLYAEWRSAGVSGQVFEPHDTEYGLREGAHVDRDGNLIRFGSKL